MCDTCDRLKKKGKRYLSLWSVMLITSLSFSFALSIKTFVVEAYEIRGASMEPTFKSGERVIVVKIGYDISRGDIIVFHAKDKPIDLVKRVLGIPGDQYFYFGKEKVLKPGEYFVLGDNRPDSHDSRYFGPVTEDQIVGEVVYRWWPWEKAGDVR